MRRRIRRWTWMRRLTAATFAALLILGSFEFFPWFRGSTTGTRTFDAVPLTDPLAMLEAALASRSVSETALLGAALLVSFAVLMGPVFCGWVCPLGLLLDLNDALRRGLRRIMGRKASVPEIRLKPQWRYFALGAALAFSLVAGVPVFQTFSPINLVAWGLLFGVVAPAVVVVALIALVEHFVPRLWCRSLCPLGALYSLIGRSSPLRVRVNAERAGKTPCRQCTARCPMGIRVMEDFAMAKRPSVVHPECTRCGACVDACPSGVLRLGFFPRRGSAAAHSQPDPLATAPCPQSEHHEATRSHKLTIAD